MKCEVRKKQSPPEPAYTRASEFPIGSILVGGDKPAAELAITLPAYHDHNEVYIVYPIGMCVRPIGESKGKYRLLADDEEIVLTNGG